MSHELRVLAMCGYPGTGKSTLMLRILQNLGGQGLTQRYGQLLDYQYRQRVAVLGRYEQGDAFGGTDKLSMAVQRDAEDYLLHCAIEPEHHVDAVAFEGDRLCGKSFLQYAQKVGQLRVVQLTVDPLVLEARRAGRAGQVGKGQNATWLRGRETKVDTVADNFSAEQIPVNTDEDFAAAAEQLTQWLRWQVDVPIARPTSLF